MANQKTVTEELINESGRLYETWRSIRFNGPTASLLPRIRDIFARIQAAGVMVGDPECRGALRCELAFWQRETFRYSHSIFFTVDTERDSVLAKPNWEKINQAEFGEVKGRMVTELTKLLKRLMHPNVGYVETRRIAIGIINAGWTLAEGGQG